MINYYVKIIICYIYESAPCPIYYPKDEGRSGSSAALYGRTALFARAACHLSDEQDGKN